MSGNLTAPVKFSPTSTWNITDLDGDFQAFADYINVRQITFDVLANRPATASPGQYYFATDVVGGQLYVYTGTFWQPVGAALDFPAAMTNTISGMGLANNGGAPNTTIDLAPGICASDEANALARTPLFRDVTESGTVLGTWAFGLGQPKLDTGVVTPNTWYHVFAILNQSIGANDMLISASPSAPVMPAGYTRKRRLGSFKTDAGSLILPFVQRGDSFSWKTSVLEMNQNNPGIVAFTHAIASVPSGVAVQAVLLAGAQNDANAGTVALLVSDLAVTDQVPDNTLMTLSALAENGVAGFVRFGLVPVNVWTNTSAQVRVRLSFSDANVFAIMRVMGWIDRRGQDG